MSNNNTAYKIHPFFLYFLQPLNNPRTWQKQILGGILMYAYLRQIHKTCLAYIKYSREFKRTIIMVTHNPELAAATDRAIHIRDGAIEKDIINVEMSNRVLSNRR